MSVAHSASGSLGLCPVCGTATVVEDLPYRDMKEMHQFAAQSRRRHLGQWFTVQAVGVLFAREASGL